MGENIKIRDSKGQVYEAAPDQISTLENGLKQVGVSFERIPSDTPAQSDSKPNTDTGAQYDTAFKESLVKGGKRVLGELMEHGRGVSGGLVDLALAAPGMEDARAVNKEYTKNASGAGYWSGVLSPANVLNKVPGLMGLGTAGAAKRAAEIAAKTAAKEMAAGAAGGAAKRVTELTAKTAAKEMAAGAAGGAVTSGVEQGIREGTDMVSADRMPTADEARAAIGRVGDTAVTGGLLGTAAGGVTALARGRMASLRNPNVGSEARKKTAAALNVIERDQGKPMTAVLPGVKPLDPKSGVIARNATPGGEKTPDVVATANALKQLRSGVIEGPRAAKEGMGRRKGAYMQSPRGRVAQPADIPYQKAQEILDKTSMQPSSETGQIAQYVKRSDEIAQRQASDNALVSKSQEADAAAGLGGGTVPTMRSVMDLGDMDKADWEGIAKDLAKADMTAMPAAGSKNPVDWIVRAKAKAAAKAAEDATEQRVLSYRHPDFQRTHSGKELPQRVEYPDIDVEAYRKNHGGRSPKEFSRDENIAYGLRSSGKSTPTLADTSLRHEIAKTERPQTKLSEPEATETARRFLATAEDRGKRDIMAWKPGDDPPWYAKDVPPLELGVTNPEDPLVSLLSSGAQERLWNIRAREIERRIAEGTYQGRRKGETALGGAADDVDTFTLGMGDDVAPKKPSPPRPEPAPRGLPQWNGRTSGSAPTPKEGAASAKLSAPQEVSSASNAPKLNAEELDAEIKTWAKRVKDFENNAPGATGSPEHARAMHKALLEMKEQYHPEWAKMSKDASVQMAQQSKRHGLVGAPEFGKRNIHGDENLAFTAAEDAQMRSAIEKYSDPSSPSEIDRALEEVSRAGGGETPTRALQDVATLREHAALRGKAGLGGGRLSTKGAGISSFMPGQAMALRADAAARYLSNPPGSSANPVVEAIAMKYGVTPAKVMGALKERDKRD